jgi:MSHA biogenesis protein MshL
VILEAKIIEVTLNDHSQAGVNWAVFGNHGSSRAVVGNVSPGTVLAKAGSNAVSNGELLPALVDAGISNGSLASTGSALASAATGGIGGSLFAIAIQTANFASLISFLESQGDVHVLSSPRIATINNQVAVLKVGTDEFFVTGVSTSTIASTGATTTIPEVTLNPFFSGISLSVMPQIDEHNNITLHIHPQVSDTTTVNKRINVGTGQTISLPLASSKVSETDSIVRAKDGQVIALGGLMQQMTISDRSKVPGLGDSEIVGTAFRQNELKTVKSELIILLKPTVVQSENNWGEDILSTQQRINNLERPESPK